MNPSLHAIRNVLVCITFLEMLIVAQMASVNASPDTTVKVDPYTTTAGVGEKFTINIIVNDVQNLFGLEVSLYWDASILQIIDVDIRLGVESNSDGVLHEPIYFVSKNETTQQEGKYQLVGMSTGGETSSFSGSGNILRMTFNVIGAGSCKLDLETELADKPPLGGVASPIEHTTIDGFYRMPEQPTLPYRTTLIVAIIIMASVITAVTAIYYARIKRVAETRAKPNQLS